MDTFIKALLIFFVTILSFSVGIFLGKGITESEYKQASLKCEYENLKKKKNKMEDLSFMDKESTYLEKESYSKKIDLAHLNQDLSDKKMKEEVSKLSRKFIEEEKQKQQKSFSSHLKESSKNPSSPHQNEDLSKTKMKSKKDLHLAKMEKKSSLKPDQEEYKLLSKEKNSNKKKEDSLSLQRKSSHYTLLSEIKKQNSNQKISSEKKKEKMIKSTKMVESKEESKIEKKQKLSSFKAPKIEKTLPLHRPGISTLAFLSEKKKKRLSKNALDEMKSFPHKARYTIQVASYKNKKDAKNHVSSLKSNGYGAFYLKAKVKNEIWYRVSIGIFPIKKSAMEFQEELKKEAGVKASFIQKISH